MENNLILKESGAYKTKSTIFWVWDFRCQPEIDEYEDGQQEAEKGHRIPNLRNNRSPTWGTVQKEFWHMGGGDFTFRLGSVGLRTNPLLKHLIFTILHPGPDGKRFLLRDGTGRLLAKKFGYRDSEKILKAKTTYTGPLIFILDIITITFLWNHDMITELDGCNTL